MMITVHLSDGRKITKDSNRLIFLTDPEGTADGQQMILDGCITINWSHVVDMRPADEIEKKHAEIHGW